MYNTNYPVKNWVVNKTCHSLESSPNGVFQPPGGNHILTLIPLLCWKGYVFKQLPLKKVSNLRYAVRFRHTTTIHIYIYIQNCYLQINVINVDYHHKDIFGTAMIHVIV